MKFSKRIQATALAALACVLVPMAYANPQALDGQGSTKAQPSPEMLKLQDEMAKLVHKSAEQGDVGAQNLLGTMYMKGQGMPQNPGEAAKWFRKAAEQGDARGQNFLGETYEQGQGVAANPVMAYVLFSLAAAKGHGEAVLNRDRVAKQLSPSQLARAQKASSAWKVGSPLPDVAP